jgi:hypothetical protein
VNLEHVQSSTYGRNGSRVFGHSLINTLSDFPSSLMHDARVDSLVVTSVPFGPMRSQWLIRDGRHSVPSGKDGTLLLAPQAGTPPVSILHSPIKSGTSQF